MYSISTQAALVVSQKVMSNSLQACELQHTRLPCSLLSPWVCSGSRPVMPSNCVSDAIQPSHPVAPLSPTFNLYQHQSFPMRRLFLSGDQNIGVSASASVLPMNMQRWFPLGLTDLISFPSKGFQMSSPAPQFKSIHFWHSAFFMVQLSCPYMTTGKTRVLTIQTIVSKAVIKIET